MVLYFPIECLLLPAEATDLLSNLGSDGMTVLFRPNEQQKCRIMDRVAQLADQEKENVSLAERNRVLADSLADELKKSSNRSSGSMSSLQLTTNLLILEMIQAVLRNLPLFQLRI